MLCLVAWVIFGILGIFSVKYRSLAKESFDCVFRRLIFKKCESNFNQKMKSKIVGKLMKFSPRGARRVYKHYEVFSWIFVIIFVASMIWGVIGAYNLIVYDNCAGPNADPEQCIFTPEEEIVSCGDPLCEGGHCEECGDSCDCGDCS
jgi:hypothetical protein